ncbi:DNA-directed RNA polymerase V subunit 1 isoform X2 [Aristolochia californica]
MEGSFLPSFIREGRAISLQFNVSTLDEILKSSVSGFPISHPGQLGNSFLGLPLESGNRCESCGTSEHGLCEGHFGYIELPVPIYDPRHIGELRRILSIICLKCLRVKGKVSDNPENKKMSYNRCTSCQDCRALSIKEAKSKNGATYLEMKLPSASYLKSNRWQFLVRYGYDYGGEALHRSLLPSEALEILKNIPEETKRRLASKGYHPQNGFIMECLPVPPNCLSAPDVSNGVAIMSSDPSKSLLKKILTVIGTIRRSRSGSPKFESNEIEANALQYVVMQYLQLRGTSKATDDFRRKFLLGKEEDGSGSKAWLEKMKTLFIRKGSGFSSRSVISGDAYKGVDEIGIPLEIARKVTFEERVTAHNILRMQELMEKGLCVTYRDGTTSYTVNEGYRKRTTLKIGQIVNRAIMDGDVVFINRPPTTHKHSLQAFSVYVHNDHTVKINPLICAPLSADFDGDCVHLFYPQSLAAKAEVLELFSVEKQLLSSHTGNLNLQLVHDSLLSLKLLFKTFFLSKPTAQQLAMFVSSILPEPALPKSSQHGPLWTVLQVLQSALPADLDCFAERYLIRQSEMLRLDYNRDSLQSSFREVVTSVLMEKGPKEAVKFFNLVQPLLMEILFSKGYSVGLRDFFVSKDVLADLKMKVQHFTHQMQHMRSRNDEFVELQVENDLNNMKLPIVTFLLKLSAMGNLIDSKSRSAICKIVEQLGFLGLQLYTRGKFYSKGLVDDMYLYYKSRFNGSDCPSEAFGLVKSAFFEGLNPFEELTHSISSRETLIRSSRGLTEPGTLFKNLMAVLRDVVMCYDGTVRNICSNSVVQFEYRVGPMCNMDSVAPAGEPVGILAATAVSNPAYKAVLDSSQSNNSSWALMKEVLLCKINFNKEYVNDRRVVLFLNDCNCGKKYCKENSAYILLNLLERITLKDFATEFTIQYQKQQNSEGAETNFSLVGHIHFDKVKLMKLNIGLDEICQKCDKVIEYYRKKRSSISHLLKETRLFASECCTLKKHCVGEWSQVPCLQFYQNGIASSRDDNFKETSEVMGDVICPVLLKTILKGDSRLSQTNIIWTHPNSMGWVRKEGKSLKGEVALEILVEKDAVKQHGDAWRVVLDSCLPLMHLIDVNRSIPYGMKQIQELLGISCAFEQAVQRLEMSINSVDKGVLKEHLKLVASSMTCTGNLIGFNPGGCRALFRSSKVQVPMMEATLFAPMKSFERSAEKCYSDSLSGTVASCAWGKTVSIGTGTQFEFIWNGKEMKANEDVKLDAYEFLHLVTTSFREKEASTKCIGLEVDELDGDEDLASSPEQHMDFDEPHFDEGNASKKSNSGWEESKQSAWSSWSATDTGPNASCSDPVDNSDAWKCWKSKDADMWDKEAQKNSAALADESNSKSGWKSRNEGFKKGPCDAVDTSDAWECWKSKDADRWDEEVQKKTDGLPNESDSRSGWKPRNDKFKRGPCDAVDASDAWQYWKSKDADKWDKEAHKKPASLPDGSVSRSGWKSGNEGLQSGPREADCNTSLSYSKSGAVWESNDSMNVWDRRRPQVHNDPSTPKSNSWEDWRPNSIPTDNAWESLRFNAGSGLDGLEDSRRNDTQKVSPDESNAWNANSIQTPNDQSSPLDDWASKEIHAKRSPAADSWTGSRRHGWSKGVTKSHSLDASVAGVSKNEKSHSTKVSDHYSAQASRNTSGIFTATRRRKDQFTTEEVEILNDVDPVITTIKNVLHKSSNCERLSDDDQKYILENVFSYHPDKSAKMGNNFEYITVDEAQGHQGSRCFYLVSSDGAREDFSYHKCIKNYVQVKYPEMSESFSKKYFKKPG